MSAPARRVEPCLEPDDLLALARGDVTPAQRATALAHVEGCAVCSETLSALARIASIASIASSSSAMETVTDRPARAEPRAEVGGRLGRFRVTRVLGRGGMGLVVAARDEQLERDVAIKVVRPELATAAFEGRLVREGRALAALRHPNLVAVLEVGEAEGVPFLVMELVEGVDLRRWVAATPTTWRAVMAHCLAAGHGLAALHAAGYLHRDVKPDNVIVARDGRVVLADFGLAKRIDRDAADPLPATTSEPLTRAGAIVGTPRYLAPERVAGDPGDVRSDVYSFAVMTLEVIRARAERLPRRVLAVLARAVDPAAEARFASMSALLAALERALAPRRLALALVGVALIAGAASAVWLAGADSAPEVASAGSSTAERVVVEPPADASVPGTAPPVDAPSSIADASSPVVVADAAVATRAPEVRRAPPAPRVTTGSAATFARAFERELTIEFLRELGRVPATAAFAEHEVLQRGGACGKKTDDQLGWDWGIVERKGLVDVTYVEGQVRRFLLYQVQGQRRRYLFDAYTTQVFLDVPVGTKVLLCPNRERTDVIPPAGWRGDFVWVFQFGGPITGPSPVLSRTPRPRYLSSGPHMAASGWPYADTPVLFVVKQRPRELLDGGRRDMGIYFLDAAPELASALDRATPDQPVWVIATFRELHVRNGTEYPALRVDEVRATLFEAP